jgi:hypothetical protein
LDDDTTTLVAGWALRRLAGALQQQPRQPFRGLRRAKWLDSLAKQVNHQAVQGVRRLAAPGGSFFQKLSVDDAADGVEGQVVADSFHSDADGLVYILGCVTRRRDGTGAVAIQWWDEGELEASERNLDHLKGQEFWWVPLVGLLVMRSCVERLVRVGKEHARRACSIDDSNMNDVCFITIEHEWRMLHCL